MLTFSSEKENQKKKKNTTHNSKQLGFTLFWGKPSTTMIKKKGKRQTDMFISTEKKDTRAKKIMHNVELGGPIETQCFNTAHDHFTHSLDAS